jgi:CRISPR system Cascade subunit CasE
MYLSKIHIPWPQAKNIYHLHQALWLLFPDRQDDDRDFLYRVESIQKGLGAQVLMQSLTEPETGEHTPVISGKREFRLQLESGQRLRYRLRANPIKTIKDAGGRMVEKKGKTSAKTIRVPLIREEEQKAWIVRKFDGIARLESVVIQPENAFYFRKPQEKHPGKISTVLFDGILSVGNPTALKNELGKGIGPAKAFGCGLLSLARA